MQRFLALLGERKQRPAPALPNWRLVLDAPRAQVFLSEASPQASLSRDPNTTIIGDMRGCGDSRDCGQLRTASDRCARIMRDAWGAYVAILADGQSGRWCAFRDPSGRLPCFFTAVGRAQLFFSDIRDAIAFGWRRADVDWTFMAALIQDGRIRDGRTALKGVFEVLPGERVDEEGARTQEWRPSEFIEGPVEDRPTARAMLRDAVQQSVTAAAERYQRIQHLLSGGLDSSTVLACIKNAGFADRVRCLTYTQGQSSELDELTYARAAARAAGVELMEAQLQPGCVRLDRRPERTMHPRPLGYAFSIENDDIERQYAKSWGAEACFTGAGGDGLFFQLRARTYCADYLIEHGPSLGALRVAYDNARLARVSFWTALREGYRLAYGHEEFEPEAAPRNPYLAADAGHPAADWLAGHPWFRGASRLSPGKRLHLWAVLDCLNLFYPYRRAEVADTEFVLITQRVIEAVLRIPSWVLSSGGRDRSLLREAFAGEVPDIILARNAKGAMDGYYAELCAANAAHMRERLLDGALMREGLLDRTVIERDLPRAGDPRDGRELLLLRLFATEAWAAAWAHAPALT